MPSKIQENVAVRVMMELELELLNILHAKDNYSGPMLKIIGTHRFIGTQLILALMVNLKVVCAKMQNKMIMNLTTLLACFDI
jgi:hypothetical protein